MYGRVRTGSNRDTGYVITMRITYVNYPDGYVNVQELMNRQLPRPNPRTTSLKGDGETLPIITIEAET